MRPLKKSLLFLALLAAQSTTLHARSLAAPLRSYTCAYAAEAIATGVVVGTIREYANGKLEIVDGPARVAPTYSAALDRSFVARGIVRYILEGRDENCNQEHLSECRTYRTQLALDVNIAQPELSHYIKTTSLDYEPWTNQEGNPETIYCVGNVK